VAIQQAFGARARLERRGPSEAGGAQAAGGVGMQEGDCLWSELRSRGVQGSPLLVNRGNGGGSSSQCGVVTARKTKG
jgi:hypothetical protein